MYNKNQVFSYSVIGPNGVISTWRVPTMQDYEKAKEQTRIKATIEMNRWEASDQFRSIPLSVIPNHTWY